MDAVSNLRNIKTNNSVKLFNLVKFDIDWEISSYLPWKYTRNIIFLINDEEENFMRLKFFINGAINLRSSSEDVVLCLYIISLILRSNIYFSELIFYANYKLENEVFFKTLVTVLLSSFTSNETTPEMMSSNPGELT